MGTIPRKNEKYIYNDEYFLDLFAASHARGLTDAEVKICQKHEKAQSKHQILRFDLHRKVNALSQKTGKRYQTEGCSRPDGILISSYEDLKKEIAKNDSTEK